MVSRAPVSLCKCVTIILLLTYTHPSWGSSQEFDLGYAQCVLDDVFAGEEVATTMEGGTLHITVRGDSLSSEEMEHIIKRIKRNNAITAVLFHFIENDNLSKEPARTPDSDDSSAYVQRRTKSAPTSEFLPTTPLYSTPIADPRWPKFKVGYQLHDHSQFGKSVFSLAFGENIPLYQYTESQFAVEAGVQAGLFGLMDISSSPTVLINSDYFVGFGITLEHWRKWQNLLQFSHTSSHIGDELLIKNKSLLKKRVNLSYEQTRWLTAYKFMGYRPFAGVGYLVHKDPSSVKPFSFEYGLDYLSPEKCFGDLARFVAGIHLYHWQEVNYNPSFTAVAGLQLENELWDSRKLRFLFEYANGNSREGQFYKQKHQYVGAAFILSY